MRCQPLPPLSIGPIQSNCIPLHLLLLHFPYSVVCIWLEVSKSLLSPISPPSPHWIVLAEVFMGKLAGCSAHCKIKASSAKCAVAHHDLFNSSRVNITDACKAGIRVQKLDDPHCVGRSISFLMRPTRRYQRSVVSEGQSSAGYGPGRRSQKGFLNNKWMCSHVYYPRYAMKGELERDRQSLCLPLCWRYKAHKLFDFEKNAFSLPNVTNAKSYRLKRSGSTPNS